MVEQTDMFSGPQKQLVGAKRLAQLLTVSDQTVYNWRDQGMPVEKKGGKGGGEQYDVEKCKAFLKEQKIDFLDGSAKGGKRENAGRKTKKVTTAAREIVAATSGIEQAKTMAADQPPAPVPSAPIKNAADMMGRMGTGTMSGVESRTVRDQAMAVKTLQEVELKSGKVLPTDQVEEAWASHMRTLKTRAEGFVERVNGAIAGALALKPEQAEQVRAILQREMDSLFVLMAEDPLTSADGGGDEDVE